MRNSHKLITLSSKEQACEKIFQSTHTQDKDGRFVVRLPFRENKEKFGEFEMKRTIAQK